MLEIILLTGPSGSGKSTAQYVFEESGYLIMDNIIPYAVGPTLEYLLSVANKHNKVVFIVQPQFVEDTFKILNETKGDVSLKTIVLDCEVKTLLKRFKLTRHVHPYSALNKVTLNEAIESDKYFIERFASKASYVVDTTAMEALDLRKYLFGILSSKKGTISLVFMSFGQKYGNPLSADIILDTRALPNPYWDISLRHLSGLDKEIDSYLESFDEVHETLKNMISYLNKYLELVQKDGRGNYTIGICCSGGRHRSVYFAKKLGDYYNDKYNCYVYHRDIKKED